MGGLVLWNEEGYGLKDFDIFIETGLGGGSSLFEAIGRGIAKKFISIEQNKEIADRFQGLNFGNKDVVIYHGTSPDVLNKILPPLNRYKVLFWLDAHYMGNPYENALDEKYGQCPILKELEAIRNANFNIPPIILIDDAEWFTEYNWEHNTARHSFDKSQWPRLHEIESALPDYNVEVKDGMIFCLPK